MSGSQTVVVAMSGGVDSSVAAALLVERGFRVIGMMLRLWTEPGAESQNRCCTPESMATARQIAAEIGIPFYAVDAKSEFRRTVVEYFVNGYRAGVTPNPCQMCNRKIRWGLLLDHARSLGADYMATGHYARLKRIEKQVRLLRAADSGKDQSYVLSMLPQAKLQAAMFPVGEFTKARVRTLAAEYNLPVAQRRDSQDLCFITEGDYRSFLARQTDDVIRPGEITDRTGAILGEHRGLAFYTIGQRKGLGISAAAPLYVLEKDVRQNALVVGFREELGQQTLTASDVNWIAGKPPGADFVASVQVRYQSSEAEAKITVVDENRFAARFDHPQRDVTPGQLAVLYQGQTCLGGGIIEASGDPV